jgi:hypothetical protein
MKNFDEIYDQYYKKFDILADVLPELLAVRFGLKRALSFTIESRKEFDKRYPSIKNVCAKSKLHVDYVASKRNPHNYNILVSKQKLNMINDDKDQNEGNRLSYPSCCVKAFNIKTHSYYFTNNMKNLLVDQNTFDFKMNPFLMNSPFHLFSHLPCSLHCKKTLNYAAKLLNIVKKYNKPLYAYIVYFNKTFGLYLDICGMCLLFKGKKVRDQIVYKDFYPKKLYKTRIKQSKQDSVDDPRTFREICRSLSRGNAFTLKGNKLIIKKDRKIIQTFEKPSHLFWKIIKFA